MPATPLPNLGLSGDTPNNEDNWDVADRANLRRLDAMLHLSVKDKDLATPPGSPADGDRRERVERQRQAGCILGRPVPCVSLPHPARDHVVLGEDA